MAKHVVYTDGACSGNPGPGGWAAVIFTDGVKSSEIAGGELQTTNNRMELTAVIRGLQKITTNDDVLIVTDSKYVVDSITKGWLHNWVKRGWRKSDGKPALNTDLWKQLLNLLNRYNVRFEWVKGHAGHPQNERCDQLACEVIKQMRVLYD